MGRATAAEVETGRNAPCSCGSGKRHKQCCLGRGARAAPPACDARTLLQAGLDSHRLGEVRRAAELYRQALVVSPKNPDALHLLGIAAEQEGRHDLAVDYIGRAIALNGSVPDYYRSLAIALRARGDLLAAVGCMREATRLRPADGDLHRLLGDVCAQRGDAQAAAHSYLEALQCRPSDPLALRELGNVLFSQGDYQGAICHYRAALPHAAGDANLHHNLGMALAQAGDLSEARAAYEAALALEPDAAVIKMSLASLQQELCDWDGIDALWSAVRGAVASRPHELLEPFKLLTMPSTAAEQLACARNWSANRFTALERERAALGFGARSGGRTRLHVGYLSADFHDHATTHLIAEVFERHDRRRFEISAYSLGPNDGGTMRVRIAGAVDRFVDLAGVPYGDAAGRIHGDGVDILLDLKGYTNRARPEILALRPAPIQVNYLGYPGTMGAPFISHIIADPYIIPQDQRRRYSERVAYLPDCYQPNDRQRPIASQIPTRAECGLPDDGFVFCSFNQGYKIAPAIFAVWMRLLASVPGSVLWLLAGNVWATENLRRHAQSAGVDPHRVIFAPRLGVAEHLARHRLADLFLDSLPVNAHTTASDALWAGLPVLTCAGDTFVSRVAGSLLHAVGMPDMVTTSLDEYEALALTLARDPARLAALRTRLAAARDTAPLFDSARYTRNLEALLLRIWEEQ